MHHSSTDSNEALIEVRESGIHGKGVYALTKIKKGTPISEYLGERISEAEIEEHAKT